MSVFTRHSQYYFPKGPYIFRVENTLYRLYDELLVAHSGLFKDMFAIGDAGAGCALEGKNDANPIFLEGDRQAVFDLFLDHIHGRSRSASSIDATYSHEELRDLLQFADKYRCPATRCFVIDHIWSARYTYHPAELIGLGCRFRIQKFFERGFQRLLDIPFRQISKEHRQLIGNDVFVALVYAKSMLDEHCRVIACEEPVIVAHAADCRNPTACQEDWHAIWWNGMGRLLLDGRNPQPFPDAVKRFREMQFGRMSPGCQELMFEVLDRGVGFQYADVFVANVCDGLVNDLHLNDTM